MLDKSFVKMTLAAVAATYVVGFINGQLNRA